MQNSGGKLPFGLIGNSTSYHLMVANESWIASNRNTCEIWRRGVHAAQ